MEENAMSRTPTAPQFHRLSLVIAALILGLVMGPKTATAETLAAWVQLVGPGPDASIRVITDDARCPALKADGVDLPMQVRAAPGPFFNPGTDVPAASFLVLTCEVTAPPGKSSILLDGKSLPLPAADIRRIVVLGDTGCRINKKKKRPQDCVNDWPYEKIARHAAAAHPDLVIHVGDYLYRESCNADTTDCSNTPTGYGWEEWRDDFFKPSAPLFAAAPWIVVRGNHEICTRAGEGSWFTSDKTCRERHATPWFVERLGIDCDRLLRARLWKLYDEDQFGRLRRGRGAVEYMKHLEHPDE